MKKLRSEVGAVGTIMLLVIAGVLVVAGLSFYRYAVSVRNAALDWETDLNKVVRIEVSERATYETSITEQLGLPNLKAEKMKEIVRTAMEGRYGDNPTQGKALLQVVTEAYPGTEGLNLYDKILPNISAGREAIRNKQNLRIERAQSYNRWRKDGILRAWILSGVYPSRDLHFNIGGEDYYAEAALDKMSEPISTAAVNESFKTGTEKPVPIK